jgi:hypothetical protein
MNNYISLYEAVYKMQEKINEIVDRVNNLDPSGSSDHVKTVNGYKGDVKLTGNDIPFNQAKSVNKQISDNSREIQTVKQNIADLDLSHVLAGSSAQIQLMQQNSFNSVTDAQWTAFYNSGFRLVGIVDAGYTEIQALYLQSTNEPHKPIQLKDGGGTVTAKIHQIYSTSNKQTNWLPDETDDNAYISRISVEETDIDKGTEIILYVDKKSSPAILKWTRRLKGEQNWKESAIYDANNQPPYPVTSVNGQTGAVTITAGGSTITAKTLTLSYDDSYGGFTFPSNSSVTKDNILNVIITSFIGSGAPANYTCSIIMHDGNPHVHIYGFYVDKSVQEWGASGNTITAIVQIK